MNRPVALITGAGSGIGRATAVALSREGWSVALLGRAPDRLTEAAAACAREGAAAVEILRLDLTDQSAAVRAIDSVTARFSRLDALVNNAGGGERQPISATTRESLQLVFGVNVFASALLIARAWPLFERTRAAHPESLAPAVVNVSSMATIDPFPGLFMYAASKAALESFVRSIQNERGTAEIRAFAVAPGSVETSLLRAVFDENVVPRAQTMPPERVADVISDCILGRREADLGRTIVVRSP